MDTLCALIPRTERKLVGSRVARLIHDARREAWLPLQSAGRAVCQRIGTVVMAIAPWLPRERLSLLVRYGLWAVTLDDHLDSPAASQAKLDRLRDAVAAATAGIPPARDDAMMLDLTDIAAQLSRYDNSGAAFSRFSASLRDAVNAGVEHAMLARAVSNGTASPPTAGQYLAVAARTVNYHSFAYALLAVVAGGLPSRALDRLDAALWHGARAVRLGNDMRSFKRDRIEVTLNVLTLRTAEGKPVTRRQVQREIGRHVRAHHDALKALIGMSSDDMNLGRAARSLARSLDLSVGLYRLTDLR
jgi:Terpene synthase family 2, C-terminal metal binding